MPDTIIVKLVSAKSLRGYIPFNLLVQEAAKQEHEPVFKDFRMLYNIFSGLTLTSMLVKRLGMPKWIDDRFPSYVYGIRGPEGGTMRIAYNEFHDHTTTVHISKATSLDEAKKLVLAINHDVIGRTVPNGTAVKQKLPLSREFYFDKYLAVCQGLYTVQKVKLHLYTKEDHSDAKEPTAAGKAVPGQL